MKRHTVRIVDHDPSWSALFAEECESLYRALGDLADDVQHVGSTAVPGLPAKPILDIAMVLIDNRPDALDDQPATNPSTTSEVTLDDPFAYVFTSGTTGLPKASIQTHRRWFASQYWFGKIVMNLKPTDVHYSALPFFHTNALNVSWGDAGW